MSSYIKKGGNLSFIFPSPLKNLAIIFLSALLWSLSSDIAFVTWMMITKKKWCWPATACWEDFWMPLTHMIKFAPISSFAKQPKNQGKPANLVNFWPKLQVPMQNLGWQTLILRYIVEQKLLDYMVQIKLMVVVIWNFHVEIFRKLTKNQSWFDWK